MKSLNRLIGTFALLILGLTLGPSAALAQIGTLPKFGHVIIVLEENTDYSSSIGSNMPYLTSLYSNSAGLTGVYGGLATNYYADTHPSIGNYMTITTGEILTNDDGQTPSSFPVTIDNIALEAQNAGKTWKDYVESSGTYYVRHDPLAYMTTVNSQTANYVDFSQFATDVKNGTLPNLSWIVPNGCDDAHDCGLSTADNWLKNNIGPALQTTQFKTDGLLIVVFDENGGSGSTTTTGTTDGGQVEMVVVSPFVKNVAGGYRSSIRYYHETSLRLMAQGLGTAGYPGSSASVAANMADFFSSGGGTGTVTVSPTSLSFGNQTVNTTSGAQTVSVSNGTASSVSLGAPSITGTNSSEFAIASNACGTSLASLASCAIGVTFKPTATGSASATLSIVAGSSTLTAGLAGTGVTMTASLSPTSLSFGNQTVNTTSATQFSTLTNTGSSTLTINSETITSGPFAFAGLGTCGASLAPGASCTVSVNFTPTLVQSYTGTVTVSDSAGSQTISLSGAGVSSGGGGGGTDYYVSTTGSDSSGNGSATSPWATIAYASTKVGPGATVHVAAGTYTGSFNTNSSGTSSAYITYVSTTKWGAKIVPSGSSTWSNYGNFVAIENFDVSGPPSSCCNGIYTAGNATKIIGNDVHGTQTSNGCSSTGGGGIVVDSTNGQVIDNYVHDNGPSSACPYIHGIYIGNSNNASNGTIAWNNICFRNSGWGIQLWHSATNEIVASNTIFHNLTGGIVVGAGSGSSVTDDYTTVTNNIVFNNPGTDGGIVEEGTTGTHNFYSHNLAFQNTPVDISLQNGLTASNTVSANPAFVNYTGDDTGDYHLTSTSPAVNAGAGPTVCASGATNCEPTNDFDGITRPQGSAWDIGAYEFVFSSSVTLAPTSLTFASQTVGTTSTAQTVTVSNGTASAVSLSFGISGTNSGDFKDPSPTCGTSLAAGASCTIPVTFDPTATGTRTATLGVTAGTTVLSASLTGTGAAATLPTLSPTSLTFASQPVGSTSYAQAVTVSNGSTSSVSLSTPSVTGTNSADFKVFATTCGTSLAASASCTISVNFDPPATGTRSATLGITAGTTALSASLTGTGVSPTPPALSPTSLTFASQAVGTTSYAQALTVSNGSASSVSLSSPAITGTNSADFKVFATTCGTSLAVNASCTISVNFDPTATGTRTATLGITAGTTALSASLTGTGASSSGPVVSLSPTSVNFGTVLVGSTSSVSYVTLTNTGNSALTITSAFTITGTNSGDFAFAGLGTCPGVGATVAAGGSCTISVNFTPTATGTRSALVSLFDNAPNTPQTIPLSGTGGSSSSGPAVTLSPASLNFPSTNVGTTSIASYVTLSNTGNSTLTITSAFTITGTNSGDFAFAGLGTCPGVAGTVAAGSSCTISVNFTPTATGTRTAQVNLFDNASNSPQSIPLSGTGGSSTTTSISVSPTSLSFGSQTQATTSAPKTVTVSNTGSSTVAVTATTAAPFATTVSSACSALAAGANCIISVTFTPTSLGTKSGTLTVTTGSTSVSVALKGHGGH